MNRRFTSCKRPFAICKRGYSAYLNHRFPELLHQQTSPFYPIVAHFGSPTFLAYLLSPAHLVRVDDDAIDMVHVAQLQRSVHVALFIEEGAANEWLVQQAGK